MIMVNGRSSSLPDGLLKETMYDPLDGPACDLHDEPYTDEENDRTYSHETCHRCFIRRIAASTFAVLAFATVAALSQLRTVEIRRPDVVTSMRARADLAYKAEVAKQDADLEQNGTELEKSNSAGAAAPGDTSLYCFTLVQPGGYELGLIDLQYKKRASIFECDGFSVYSSKRVKIAPGIFTGVVNSSLVCDLGGEFDTALNTGIFLAVWAKVIADGAFEHHAFTVKVDADAVFVPGRLRYLVLNRPDVNGGIYLNNCKFGLHGPLEVFSRNAVRAWANGAGDCVTHFTKLCSGFCGWGEDMFIDQCLQRVIGVRREDEFRLLLEAHCEPPEHWHDCTDQTVTAFHPFKTEEAWMTCLINTRRVP